MNMGSTSRTSSKYVRTRLICCHDMRDRSKRMGRGTYYGVRYDAASEELHIAATRNINTIHQTNSDALQTTRNPPY